MIAAQPGPGKHEHHEPRQQQPAAEQNGPGVPEHAACARPRSTTRAPGPADPGAPVDVVGSPGTRAVPGRSPSSMCHVSHPTEAWAALHPGSTVRTPRAFYRGDLPMLPVRADLDLRLVLGGDRSTTVPATPVVRRRRALRRDRGVPHRRRRRHLGLRPRPARGGMAAPVGEGDVAVWPSTTPRHPRDLPLARQPVRQRAARGRPRRCAGLPRRLLPAGAARHRERRCSTSTPSSRASSTTSPEARSERDRTAHRSGKTGVKSVPLR